VSRLRGESGFSLVELLTVMVILVVVLTGLTTLFVQGSNSELDMNNRFQAQLNTRLGLDKLRRELHCANAATVSAAGDSVVLTNPCVSSNTNNVRWCLSGSGSRYGLYRIVGSNLTTTCTTSGAAKYVDYLTNASGAAFWYDGPWVQSLGKVHVDLKVNVKPSRTVDTYELCDVVVLRNTTRSGASAPATVPATTPRC
jgi:prepilin-type N-terminal cleavage/methylation domain-containing protein